MAKCHLDSRRVCNNSCIAYEHARGGCRLRNPERDGSARHGKDPLGDIRRL